MDACICIWVVPCNSLLSPHGTLLTFLCSLLVSSKWSYWTRSKTPPHSSLFPARDTEDTCMYHLPEEILEMETNVKAATIPWPHHWKSLRDFTCPVHFQGRDQTPGSSFLSCRNKYLILPKWSQWSFQGTWSKRAGTCPSPKKGLGSDRPAVHWEISSLKNNLVPICSYPILFTYDLNFWYAMNAASIGIIFP